MTFTLPDNFDFSVKYRYLESVYNRRRFSPLTTGSHNNDFTYTYKGKQLRATKTQTVTAYGYDLVDLTDVPVTLFTIPNTPHTTQTKIINTNKRYVVLRCSTAYQIAETDLTESLVDAAEFEADNSVAVFDIPADPNAGISAFFNSLLRTGELLNPHSRVGFVNPAFPANLPASVHTFQQTIIDEAFTPAQFIISRFGAVTVNSNIGLTLETLGSDGAWYEVRSNLGRISETGQTTLILSTVSADRKVVFSRAPNAMRLAVTNSKPVRLTISATLTN